MCVSVANGMRQEAAGSAQGGEGQSHGSASGIGRQTIRKRADRIGATLTIEEKGMRHLLTLTYKFTTR